MTKLLSTFFTLPSNYHYRVKRLSYSLKNFPFSNYKILQLSDLHLGYGLQPEFISSLRDTTFQLNPDIVVLTGDLIEADIFTLVPALNKIREITSYYPTYLVIGNHDFEYNKPDDVLEIFSALGIIVLINESVWIGNDDVGFNLAGISDPIAIIKQLPKKFYPSIERTIKNVRFNAPTILLSHRPIVRYCDKKFGVDLILSGHMHGGQIYPFGLLSMKFKEDSGEKVTTRDMSFNDRCYLHVSKGLGFTTLPFRFLAGSEVSLITLN